MAELVRGRPLPKIDYLPSLGLDVLSTMHLVTLVHDFEGLSEWLFEADSAMSPRLRHDLRLLFRFGNHGAAIIEELAGAVLFAVDSPAHSDFAALDEAIAQVTPTQMAAMLASALQKSAARHEVVLDQPIADIVADQERLEALLGQLGVPVPIAEAVALVQDPAGYHELLGSACRRFWEKIYAEEYARSQEQRERNAVYQRSHARPNFADLFIAVTGRMLPAHIPPRLAEVDRVRFVPSLHLGPYVAFLFNGPQMTVFYNSRTTPSQEDDFEERVQSMYLPLEAMADKTRLQIMALLHHNELYAQEIVDRLRIHQSAVSRHLKLMETAGILTVRRDKGSKFYSINSEVIEQLRRQLAELL